MYDHHIFASMGIRFILVLTLLTKKVTSEIKRIIVLLPSHLKN